jgi:endonuclease/exonuclease/phosphatase family metal-dependent hydrolase
LIKRAFIILNLLALSVLALSVLACYIEPTQYWQLSFIGFAFPVVLIINCLFLAGWALAFNRFAWVPLIAIALAWKFIHITFAYNFNGVDKEQGSSASLRMGIKLMTWNVKAFDLYNWSHNTETRSKMMALIKKENPDVLCLQEFYTNSEAFQNLAYIRDTLGYPYCYFPPAVELVRAPLTLKQKKHWPNRFLDQQWGVATFSRFPIIDTGKVDFGKTLSNSCIYTTLNINGKPVRLYNVHFQSIHLGEGDYAALEELEDARQTPWNSIKTILKKMRLAYTLRSLQANAVAKSMAGYTGSKIICGDFNDVPVSYTYHLVSDDLQDAFVEAGSGFSSTFSNRFSIFRIDYALLDPLFKVNSYRVVHKELSDHYPVIVTFNL